MNERPGELQPSEDVADFRDPASFTVNAGEHRLEVVAAGADRLAALLDLIEGASRSVQLSFYIFEDDRTGRRVLEALVTAAQRGVDVRLIVDGFGAAGDGTMFRPLVKAGGTFWLFSPKWTRHFLIRNHQKIVIADGTRALVGGFNVADEYFAPPPDDGWNDLGVVIEGPAVARLVKWFARLEEWVSGRPSHWLQISRAVRRWKAGTGPVEVLIGGPTARPSPLLLNIRRDLDAARQLDMMMAYFSPSNLLMRKIAAVAKRGQARLVTAAKSDNGATIGATRSLYTYLLENKVTLHEFQPCKLHTKLIVIDDITYIGSANFDMRSLFLNLEIMLRIEDPALAEHMRRHIEHHRAASHAIDLEEHRKRATLFNRIRWNLAWFLVSTLDYTVTRRLNLGL